MRRKLVDFDSFKSLQENSLTSKENELILAENILADALGLNHLKLYSFNEYGVTYETPNGNYINASYTIKDKNIIFENIEEIVIDEVSAKTKNRKLLSDLVEEIINNNKSKANELFEDYIKDSTFRRSLSEGTKNVKKKKELPFAKKKKEKKVEVKIRTKAPKKKLKEWNSLTENVKTFLNYKEFGLIRESSESKTDEKGNIVALKIPVNKVRNEGKVLHFDWKTLNTNVVVLRNKAKGDTESGAFAHAVKDLKSANAVSDNDKMENVIEAIITKWPNLIYLTQNELSENIKNALDALDVNDYDDEICNFLAEGVLRKATEVYSEKTSKVLKLAGVNEQVGYEEFANVVNKFYPSLDENIVREMQVFVDLYNTLNEVHKVARDEGNTDLYRQTNKHLENLHDVITRKTPMDFELAEEVSNWLSALVETNLETSNWDVSNTPYVTVTGENPQLNKYAKKGYTPADDFSGDWGSPAPVSDGKNYKGKEVDDMRYNSWGNIANKDTWPDLENPLVNNADNKVWKMPGEKNVVDDNEPLGQWQQGGKTWGSGLENPYVPKGVTPYTYKAKNDNLVVDQ